VTRYDHLPRYKVEFLGRWAPKPPKLPKRAPKRWGPVSDRDLRIAQLREGGGWSYRRLAAEFGLTHQRVHQIVARVRARLG
jgi:ribosome-binding protein aMBF1 (putative translation factor)